MAKSGHVMAVFASNHMRHSLLFGIQASPRCLSDDALLTPLLDALKQSIQGDRSNSNLRMDTLSFLLAFISMPGHGGAASIVNTSFCIGSVHVIDIEHNALNTQVLWRGLHNCEFDRVTSAINDPQKPFMYCLPLKDLVAYDSNVRIYCF
jgi:hypothetical protein